MVALNDQTAKGKGLSSAHVNVLTVVDRLGAVVQNTLEVLVNHEVLWWVSNGLSNVLENVGLDCGGKVRENLSGKLLGALESVPCAGQPFLGSGLVVLAASK